MTDRPSSRDRQGGAAPPAPPVSPASRRAGRLPEPLGGLLRDYLQATRALRCAAAAGDAERAMSALGRRHELLARLVGTRVARCDRARVRRAVELAEAAARRAVATVARARDDARRELETLGELRERRGAYRRAAGYGAAGGWLDRTL